MKVLYVFFLFVLVVACSKNESSQSLNQPVGHNCLTENIETNLNTTNDETFLESNLNSKNDELKEFGEFSINRNSEIKDVNGWMISPFQYAVVRMDFFKQVPEIGEKITVIPLGVKIESFQLQILNITKKSALPYPSPDSMPYSVEFEKITDRKILTIKPLKNYNEQSPFGIFTIYPAVDYAKSIDKSTIAKKNLPHNVSVKRVESAIDLDKDNKPDLLSVTFCCDDPTTESSENCPYLCYKYYQRVNETWKMSEMGKTHQVAK